MADWTLKKLASFTPSAGPVITCVMDGVGLGSKDESDAVFLARKPNLDWLTKNALYTTLSAHGVAVGMPSNADMGNSEVGHNALGAGRVYDQGAKLVQNAVDNGELFASEAWKKTTGRVRESGQPLHFIGLLSDGNVHSHIGHLKAMIQRADAEGVAKIRVHVLLDGRDVPETSAFTYVDDLEQLLTAMRDKGRDYWVASGGGRMKVTMDRYEAEWHMVETGWKTHVLGEGRMFGSVREAVETFRGESPGIGDQNLPAFVIRGQDGGPLGPIRDGAAVVFFNFRGDRAIEITQVFEQENFDKFPRGKRPDVVYAGMMQYDGDLKLPNLFLVSPPHITESQGEYLAKNGVTQLAISETQKYGHVTYFWNGNRSGKFADNETYVEIPSDALPFEERPWMKAAEITDRLLLELASGKYKAARLNYANGDMVGHTGHRDATILAVEAVDLELGRLMRFIEKAKGILVVTADHGNADEMYGHKKDGSIEVDANGRPKSKTSHTLNPVPFAIYAPGLAAPLKLNPAVAKPGLGNVAATTFNLLGFRAPDDYMPSLLALE
ncbi:MAG TPA: 2,3-bisphosphoglycerate-independent phosphoglycerate mutase [Polyangiaceae bacterium]|nr:2,3-bisphosphoglycerate-independent phosphoglycerate mutase [Polyangiaceae bacterium]